MPQKLGSTPQHSYFVVVDLRGKELSLMKPIENCSGLHRIFSYPRQGTSKASFVVQAMNDYYLGQINQDGKLMLRRLKGFSEWSAMDEGLAPDVVKTVCFDACDHQLNPSQDPKVTKLLQLKVGITRSGHVTQVQPDKDTLRRDSTFHSNMLKNILFRQRTRTIELHKMEEDLRVSTSCFWCQNGVSGVAGYSYQSRVSKSLVR